MQIDIELVGRVSRKFQVGQANAVDGYLIGPNRGGRLEILCACIGDVIVLINAIAADTEPSD
jgi:hypothetical protein